MNRRRFLKKSVAATTVIMGSGLMLSSCKRNLRSELMGIDRLSEKPNQMDHDVNKILYYASLAPSGHNSQPWFVKIISKTQWIVGADADRRLSQVDGYNRETMLSLGAFMVCQKLKIYSRNLDNFICY